MEIFATKKSRDKFLSAKWEDVKFHTDQSSTWTRSFNAIYRFRPFRETKYNHKKSLWRQWTCETARFYRWKKHENKLHICNQVRINSDGVNTSLSTLIYTDRYSFKWTELLMTYDAIENDFTVLSFTKAQLTWLVIARTKFPRFYDKGNKRCNVLDFTTRIDWNSTHCSSLSREFVRYFCFRSNDKNFSQWLTHWYIKAREQIAPAWQSHTLNIYGISTLSDTNSSPV